MNSAATHFFAGEDARATLRFDRGFHPFAASVTYLAGRVCANWGLNKAVAGSAVVWYFQLTIGFCGQPIPPVAPNQEE